MEPVPFGARDTDYLIGSVDHLSLGRYFGIIGATIWTYDYILTITNEVTLVWSRKFSLVNLLYFTVRAFIYHQTSLGSLICCCFTSLLDFLPYPIVFA